MRRKKDPCAAVDELPLGALRRARREGPDDRPQVRRLGGALHNGTCSLIAARVASATSVVRLVFVNAVAVPTSVPTSSATPAPERTVANAQLAADCRRGLSCSPPPFRGGSTPGPLRRPCRGGRPSGSASRADPVEPSQLRGVATIRRQACSGWRWPGRRLPRARRTRHQLVVSKPLVAEPDLPVRVHAVFPPSAEPDGAGDVPPAVMPAEPPRRAGGGGGVWGLLVWWVGFGVGGVVGFSVVGLGCVVCGCCVVGGLFVRVCVFACGFVCVCLLVLCCVPGRRLFFFFGVLGCFFLVLFMCLC